ALLGALDAQMGLGIAAIGGKDSMAGSFEGLDVPRRSSALRRPSATPTTCRAPSSRRPTAPLSSCAPTARTVCPRSAA
uniref:hypothetical protein n=1 Tax=Gemmiger formicilis TaxID=745368 RepID=UPI004026A955